MGDPTTIGSPPALVRVKARKIPVRKKHTATQYTNRTSKQDERLTQIMTASSCMTRLRGGSSRTPTGKTPSQSNTRRPTPPQRPTTSRNTSSPPGSSRNVGGKPTNKITAGAGEGRKSASPTQGSGRSLRAVARPKGDSASPTGSLRDAARRSPQPVRASPSPSMRRSPASSITSQRTGTSAGTSSTTATITTSSSGRSTQVSISSVRPNLVPKKALANPLQNRGAVQQKVQQGARSSAGVTKRPTSEKVTPGRAWENAKTVGTRSPITPKTPATRGQINVGVGMNQSRLAQSTMAAKPGMPRQPNRPSSVSSRSSPLKVLISSKPSVGTKAVSGGSQAPSTSSHMQTTQLKGPKSLTQRSGSPVKTVTSGKKWLSSARPHVLGKQQMSTIVVKTNDKETERQSSNRSLQVTSRTLTSSQELRQPVRPQMSAFLGSQPYSQHSTKSQHGMYSQNNLAQQSGYAGQMTDYSNYYQPYYDERYGWVWNINPNFNMGYNNAGMWMTPQGAYPMDAQGMAYPASMGTGMWDTNTVVQPSQKESKKSNADAKSKTSSHSSTGTTLEANRSVSETPKPVSTSTKIAVSNEKDEKPLNASLDIPVTTQSIVHTILSEKSVNSSTNRSSLTKQILSGSSETTKTTVRTSSPTVGRKDFVEVKGREPSSLSVPSAEGVLEQERLFEEKQIRDREEISRPATEDQIKTVSWAMSFSNQSDASQMAQKEPSTTDEPRSLLGTNSAASEDKSSETKYQPGIVFALNTPSSAHSLSAKIASESNSKELQKAKMLSSLSVGAKQLPEDRQPLLVLDENSKFLELNNEPTGETSEVSWESSPSSHSSMSVKISDTDDDKKINITDSQKVMENTSKEREPWGGVVHGEIEASLNKSRYPQGTEDVLRKESSYSANEKNYHESSADNASKTWEELAKERDKSRDKVTPIDEIMNMKYKREQDQIPMTEQFVHTKTWTTTDNGSTLHPESVVQIATSLNSRPIDFPFLGQQYAEKKESKGGNMLAQDGSVSTPSEDKVKTTGISDSRERAFTHILTSKSYAEKDNLKGFSLLTPSSQITNKNQAFTKSENESPKSSASQDLPTQQFSTESAERQHLNPESASNAPNVMQHFDPNASSLQYLSAILGVDQFPSTAQYRLNEHQMQELQQQFLALNSDRRGEQLPSQHYMQTKSSLTMSSDQVKPDQMMQGPQPTTTQPSALASVVLSQMQQSLPNKNLEESFDSHLGQLHNVDAKEQFNQMQQAFMSSLLQAKHKRNVSNLSNNKHEIDSMWSSSTGSSSTADSDNSSSNILERSSTRMIRTPDVELKDSSQEFSPRLKTDFVESYASPKSNSNGASLHEANNSAHVFGRFPLTGNSTGATQFTMTRGTVAETPRVPPPPAEQLPRASYLQGPLSTVDAASITDTVTVGTSTVHSHEFPLLGINVPTMPSSGPNINARSSSMSNETDTTTSVTTPISSSKEDSSSLFYAKFLSVHNTLEAPRQMLINPPSSELIFDDMDSPGTSGETSADSQSSGSKEAVKEASSGNMVFSTLKPFKLEFEDDKKRQSSTEQIKDNERISHERILSSVPFETFISNSKKETEAIRSAPTEHDSNLSNSGEQVIVVDNQNGLHYSPVTTMPVAPYGDGLRRGNPPAGARKTSSAVDLDEDEEINQEENSRTSAPALQDSVPSKSTSVNEPTSIDGSYKNTVSDTENRMSADRMSVSAGPQSLTNLSTSTDSALRYPCSEGNSAEIVNKMFHSKQTDEKTIKQLTLPEKISELQEKPTLSSSEIRRKSDDSDRSSKQDIAEQKVKDDKYPNEKVKEENINLKTKSKEESVPYKREYLPEIVGHRFHVTVTDPNVEQNLGSNFVNDEPKPLALLMNSSLQSLSFESTLNESLQSLDQLKEVKSTSAKKVSLSSENDVKITTGIKPSNESAKEKESDEDSTAEFMSKKAKMVNSGTKEDDSVAGSRSVEQQREEDKTANVFGEYRQSPFVGTRMIGSDVDQLSSQSSEEEFTFPTHSSVISSTHSLPPKGVITSSGRYIEVDQTSSKERQAIEENMLPTKMDTSMSINTWLSNLPGTPSTDGDDIDRKNSNVIKIDSKEYWNNILAGAVHLSLGVGMPITGSSRSITSSIISEGILGLPFQNESEAHTAAASLSEATFYDVYAGRVNSDVSTGESRHNLSLDRDVPSVFLNVHNGRVNSDISNESTVEAKTDSSTASYISPYELFLEQPSIYLSMDTQRANSDLSTSSFQEQERSYDQRQRFASDILTPSMQTGRTDSDVSAETFGEDGRISRLMNTSEISQNIPSVKDQGYPSFAAPVSTPSLHLPSETNASAEINVHEIIGTPLITSFISTAVNEMNQSYRTYFGDHPSFESQTNRSFLPSSVTNDDLSSSVIITSFIPAADEQQTAISFEYYDVSQNITELPSEHVPIITDFVPARQSDAQISSLLLQEEQSNFTYEQNYIMSDSYHFPVSAEQYGDGRISQVIQPMATVENVAVNRNDEDKMINYTSVSFAPDNVVQASSAFGSEHLTRLNEENPNMSKTFSYVPTNLQQASANNMQTDKRLDYNTHIQTPNANATGLNFSQVSHIPRNVSHDERNLYTQNVISVENSNQARGLLLEKMITLMGNEQQFGTSVSQFPAQETICDRNNRQWQNFQSNIINTEEQPVTHANKKINELTYGISPISVSTQIEPSDKRMPPENKQDYSQYLRENIESNNSQYYPKVFGQALTQDSSRVSSRTRITPIDFPPIEITINMHDVVKKKGAADEVMSPSGSQGGLMDIASSVSLGMPGANEYYSPNSIYKIDFSGESDSLQDFLEERTFDHVKFEDRSVEEGKVEDQNVEQVNFEDRKLEQVNVEDEYVDQVKDEDRNVENRKLNISVDPLKASIERISITDRRVHAINAAVDRVKPTGSSLFVTAAVAAENLEEQFTKKKPGGDNSERDSLVVLEVPANKQTQSSDSIVSSKTLTDETQPRGVASLPLETLEPGKTPEISVSEPPDANSPYVLTSAAPFISLNVEPSKEPSEGSINPVIVLSDSESEFIPSASGEAVGVEGPTIDTTVAVLNSLNLAKSKPKSAEGVVLRMTPIPVVPDERSSTEVISTKEDEYGSSSGVSIEEVISDEGKISLKDANLIKIDQDEVETSLTSLSSSSTSKEDNQVISTSSDISDVSQDRTDLHDISLQENSRISESQSRVNMIDAKIKKGTSENVNEEGIEVDKKFSDFDQIQDIPSFLQKKSVTDHEDTKEAELTKELKISAESELSFSSGEELEPNETPLQAEIPTYLSDSEVESPPVSTTDVRDISPISIDKNKLNIQRQAILKRLFPTIRLDTIKTLQTALDETEKNKIFDYSDSTTSMETETESRQVEVEEVEESTDILIVPPIEKKSSSEFEVNIEDEEEKEEKKEEKVTVDEEPEKLLIRPLPILVEPLNEVARPTTPPPRGRLSPREPIINSLLRLKLTEESKKASILKKPLTSITLADLDLPTTVFPLSDDVIRSLKSNASTSPTSTESIDEGQPSTMQDCQASENSESNRASKTKPKEKKRHPWFRWL